jgi:hypothetical protein
MRTGGDMVVKTLNALGTDPTVKVFSTSFLGTGGEKEALSKYSYTVDGVEKNIKT